MDVAPLSIEIRPNCSLTVRGARLFFASACVMPFGMGGFLALRRFHSQTITVSESNVSVESRQRLATERVVFPRHWAQVKLRRPAAGLHPSRLTIESHGRQCELGSFLTEEERRGLALRLQRVIGRVNESPSWP